MLCQVWGVRVKQDLASDLKGCLVLKGASHTHSTSPDSAHPLSTDAWAEGEGFPGEALKVGGKDGLEPQWRVADETERTVGSRGDGERQETTREMWSPREMLGLDAHGGGPNAWSVTRGLDREGAEQNKNDRED